MKLTEQVCTLEQAKRLKELGIEQSKNLFYFTEINKDDYWIIPVIEWTKFVALNRECLIYPDNASYWHIGNSEIIATFTVAELGVMLPHPSSLNEMGGWLHNSECDTTSTDGLPWYLLWEYDLDKENAGFGRHIISGVTEAEARAAMLIYLLENNLVTAAEVNDRLK